MKFPGTMGGMGDLTESENRRIRERMIAYVATNRLNASDLADKLKRSQPTLSTFLSAKSGISFATARRFAELIGVNVVEFLDLDPGTPANQAPPTSLDRAEQAARLLWPEHSHLIDSWVQDATVATLPDASAEDWFNAIVFARRLALARALPTMHEAHGGPTRSDPGERRRRSVPPQRTASGGKR